MQNKVRFKIGEIEFEAEGDAEVIARERSEFVSTLLPLALDSLTKAASTRQIEQITALPQSPSVYETVSPLTVEDFSRISLASYVKEKGARSNNDFVLCAAFFNEKKNGMKTFSKITVEKSFSEAKRPLPANIYDLFNRLVKSGLIMESSEKGKTSKEYTLTHNGEEYVNNMSTNQSKVKKPSSKKRKARKQQNNQNK